MTPWKEFTTENLVDVPESPGVFLLARGAENTRYVGRSNRDLATTLRGFLDKGYSHFRWVKVPWEKEAYEMQCRLYHHEGGKKRLDNKEHPVSEDPRFSQCEIACSPVGMCEI